jgi:hypothetical protein
MLVFITVLESGLGIFTASVLCALSKTVKANERRQCFTQSWKVSRSACIAWASGHFPKL